MIKLLTIIMYHAISTIIQYPIRIFLNLTVYLNQLHLYSIQTFFWKTNCSPNRSNKIDLIKTMHQNIYLSAVNIKINKL